MRRIIQVVIMAVMVMGVSMEAEAGLETIGTATYGGTDYNLIYDNDDNLTWLDYTNSGANWDNQNSWASGLNGGGALTYNFNAGVSMSWSDVWRLPTITDTGSAGCNWAYSGTDCGYNVDTGTGEMAHLFHDELGNQSYLDEFGTYRGAGNVGLQNVGDFQNLQSSVYWSGTEYSANPAHAWYFNALSGTQFYYYKGSNYRGIAVRSGDVSVAVVPEPVSMILFGVGATVLGARRKLLRRRG